MSQCHIVGNHMSRLNFVYVVAAFEMMNYDMVYGGMVDFTVVFFDMMNFDFVFVLFVCYLGQNFFIS